VIETVTRVRAAVASRCDAIVAMSPENCTYVAGFQVPSQIDTRSRLVMNIVPQAGRTRQIVANMEETYAKAETALDDVVSYNEFSDHPIDILAISLREMVGPAATVGLELDFISQAAYARLMQVLPTIEVIDATPILMEARMIKTSHELERLRRVGQAAIAMHHEALAATRPGDSELDIASRIITGLLKRGADNVLPLVVATGERSWHANAPATSRRIREGDMIRLDIFGTYKSYLSDVARTGVVGKPNAAQLRIWELLVEARNRALEMIRPGASSREIYEAYASLFRSRGYPPIDFLGHGLGLSFHEEPMLRDGSDTELQPGMFLCIEPYLMLPERNWGFQIEDEVIVTETDCELVTVNEHGDALIQVPLH
jgi:Xaa-Pro dipeptidase